MMTRLENADWTKESAGLWTAEIPDHRFAAANHPRIYPRGWRVTDNGEQVIFVRTLKAAQDWVRRNYCEQGWTVSGPTLHGTTLHWCVAITTDGNGPMTHREALDEAHRLGKEANGDGYLTDSEREALVARWELVRL